MAMRVEKYQAASSSRREPSRLVPINISTNIYAAFMDKIHVYPDIGLVYPDTEVFSRQICRRIQS
jgi:hypothetical protein